MKNPLRSSTGVGLLAVVCALSCSRGPEKPESAPLAEAPAAAPASYEGYYDVANCNGIMAWAWDKSRPDEPISVDVYDGEKKIATMTAGDYREDLKAAGKGNGRHSATLPTPRSLKDGQPHTIVLRFAGTSQELIGDRKVLTCSSK